VTGIRTPGLRLRFICPTSIEELVPRAEILDPKLPPAKLPELSAEY